MPQPSPDGVDVHAGEEQVHGGGVAERVRADFLSAQGGTPGSGPLDVPVDKGMNSETCDGLSPAVEEDRFLRRSSSDQRLQHLNGLKQQRAESRLASLAHEPDGR